MTNNCINSLLQSSSEHTFKIYLFESNREAISLGTFLYSQPEVETLVPDEPFNFNRFYNLGLEKCESEYVWLLNNDLVFEPGSTDEILKVFSSDESLLSASPWEPVTHAKHKDMADVLYGYSIIRYVCGWAIFVKKKIFDIIGPYDERFVFWYQDNDYAENLKLHGLKHALVRKSVVHHLESVSHKTIPKGKSFEFKRGLKVVFDEKWKKKTALF
jgi:GT2 family glycosyltransferase